MEARTGKPRRPHGMFHLLMHIGHLLEDRCRIELSEYGLHHGQARVLMALDRRGEGSGLIQARLAAGMDIAPATLSIMLKKLVQQGLVQRAADENDERVQKISLTSNGRKAVRRVKTVWGDADQTICDVASEHDAEELRACLLKIRDGLGGKPPEL